MMLKIVKFIVEFLLPFQRTIRRDTYVCMNFPFLISPAMIVRPVLLNRKFTVSRGSKIGIILIQIKTWYFYSRRQH